MQNEQQQNGIVLLEHPDRLTDADLGDLCEVLGGTMGTRAKRFSEWLVGWIVSEAERRQINETADTPIEPGMPRFNAADWSNSDIADALNASFALVILFGDEKREALRDFSATLHRIVAAWAAHRLRQLPD